MSREIKFRAWDKKNKKWWKWKMLDHVSITDSNVCHFFKDAKEKNLVVMQYTELKDKNGKEIYEGDIGVGGDEDRRIMKWDEDTASFIYEVNSEKTWINQKSTLDKGVEIIGNIYENKELLK